MCTNIGDQTSWIIMISSMLSDFISVLGLCTTALCQFLCWYNWVIDAFLFYIFLFDRYTVCFLPLINNAWPFPPILFWGFLIFFGFFFRPYSSIYIKTIQRLMGWNSLNWFNYMQRRKRQKLICIFDIHRH